MYARLNWAEYHPQMFENGQADWERMKAGFMRITRDYPDPWNFNNFAKYACMAEGVSTLKMTLEKVGNSPIEDAWRGKNLFAYCKSLASKGTTASGKQ